VLLTGAAGGSAAVAPAAAASARSAPATSAGPAAVPAGRAAVPAGLAAVASAEPAAAGWARSGLAARARSSATGPFAAASSVTGGVLYDVTARSARGAWAVGSSSFGGHGRALAVRWNGTTWKRVTTPRFRGATALGGVAASSARDAWAVGEYGADFSGDSTGKTLILHWNGRSWKRVPSPDPRGGGILDDVAAVSARDAWAVGQTRAGQTLIIRWNGTAWKRVPGPDSRDNLFSVAVTSARNAWAVGPSGSGKPFSVILHWNGIAWKRVPNPAGGALLERVAATSARSAWAVGGTGVGLPGKAVKPVIIRWNGSAWKKVPVPSQPGGALLIGVAASSARSAWAVGATRIFTTKAAKRLILRWNGSTWTRVASPTPARAAILFGVAASSARNAWAVGAAEVSRTKTKTVILHWNGATWK
jgi:hypothetical protein